MRYKSIFDAAKGEAVRVPLTEEEEAARDLEEAAAMNAPPPVPDVISMRQARLVLLDQGLLSQVDTIIDAMNEPDRSAARIEWEYAVELKRSHPLVAAMQASMELTDAQVDAMFTAGAAIE